MKKRLSEIKVGKYAVITEFEKDDIFLKMDIEGAEYEILNKDLNTISKKVKYLAIEFHNIKDNNYQKY